MFGNMTVKTKGKKKLIHKTSSVYAQTGPQEKFNDDSLLTGRKLNVNI